MFRKLDFGLPKMAKAVTGKDDTLWSSPLESATTLAHLYEDPLLVICFGILISSWPSSYVDH